MCLPGSVQTPSGVSRGQSHVSTALTQVVQLGPGVRTEERERYLMLRIVDGEDTRRWRASGVNDVGGATQGREVNTHHSLSLGRLSPVT